MVSAVLLHPHPDMGGNQHNNVVTALYETLGAAGVAVHRFDFASADPQAAQAQTVAAIEAAAAPVVLIGYSFGGGVAASVDHAAIAAWCLIAPALTMTAPTIGADPRPKLVLTAQDDAWFGPEVVRRATDGWAGVSHAELPGTDHFLAGPAAQRAADVVLRYVLAAGLT